MDRKRIIDILNHYGGIYSIQTESKDEFCKAGIWETSFIDEGIMQVCYNKKWYQLYEHGLGIIYYQILANITIK